ncbi:glycyl-tRNA ligase subunit beta [Actibacterium atlanticum]|uniref:Glycine--tRNA ligase beta subunit n=1 Tax=Actibacterium atlanticum TaxID=1461693 RepID=A0A058ZQ57_9RHOB|nr:glycine--tRNA ligase subunit beta [Actibacterium atlanticum]KCV83282.1 glycyl-tRNA ligase subunit beta [Actibacterium atlanticum]
MPDLLIELFSEEIPARMQKRAGEDLKKRVTDGLVEAGLTYASAAAFTTPRRLVLTVDGLTEESPNTVEERKGPKVGAPEKAVEGFLRSTGLSMDQLQVRDDKKGQVYFAVIEKTGRPAAEIIAEVLEATIRNFPWPKSMRWGAGNLRWVRPLHSILCILTREDGAEVVPLSVDGIEASNTTEGHRFMGAGRFTVSSFDDYVARLKSDKVVIDPQERADHIWADATNMAFAQGLEVVEDKGLLAEVSGLVEWPVVLMGEIGEDFLGLPPEVLQTSMKEHQKFFSVRDPKTGKIVKFVTVANVETPDNGATILAGNQKVLAARLSDAKFFWENDLRVATSGIEVWTDKLSNVTFHNKLGSQKERIERIAALSRKLAPVVGADADLAAQAARVAKADLSSEMIYEFPELQGLMGRYYAEAAGLPAEVAAACEEHYSPLGPSDDVPTADVSVAVALADKLDILTGFWAIDEKPTGSKDPFALRRAALGVIRLILTNDLRLSLDYFFDAQLLRHEIEVTDAEEAELLNEMLTEVSQHGVLGSALRTIIEKLDGDGPAWVAKLTDHAPDVSADLLGFFHDRLKVYLRDEGMRHDVIDACLAMPGSDDLTLLVKRARALNAFVATDDGVNLLQGFKRANNILTQAEEADGVEYRFGADVKFAEDATEKALFAALDAQQSAISSAIEAEDFAAAMQGMAALRAPIDAFFEAVQVNTDNQVVRRNRLNLLHLIRETCLQVADLTRVEG